MEKVNVYCCELQNLHSSSAERKLNQTLVLGCKKLKAIQVFYWQSMLRLTNVIEMFDSKCCAKKSA